MKLTRKMKTQINTAAKAKLPQYAPMLICKICERQLPNNQTTWNYDHPEQYDLYHSIAMKDITWNLGFENGALDVAIYSYKRVSDLADGILELEKNLYVKIINGKIGEIK